MSFATFTPISVLSGFMDNVCVQGTVVNVQKLHTFAGKDGEEKSVFNALLQDTSGSIPVVVWNSPALASVLALGVSVSISAPSIKEQRHGMYTGGGTSHLELHCGDRSTIEVLPTVLKLSPLHGARTFLANAVPSEKPINVIVMVGKIDNEQVVRRRSGDVLRKRDVYVYDRSMATHDHVATMNLPLWGDLSDLVLGLGNTARWTAERTVLYLEQAIVSSFGGQMQISVRKSSAMLIHPVHLREASALFSWSTSRPPALVLRFPALRDTSTFVDPDDVTERFTITKLREAAEAHIKAADSSVPIYGFVIASLSFLGSFPGSSLQRRCERCNTMLKRGSPALCCGQAPMQSLWMRVSLVDHTGTLQDVNVNDKNAQKLVGMPPETFAALTSKALEQLAHKLTFRRCKLVFKLQNHRLMNLQLEPLSLD